MMTSTDYKSIRSFKYGDLERLFLSVEWSSGHLPEKLVPAMQNFKTAHSAWDGGKLIGIICVMDDEIMNAYIHYLLVDPNYRGHVTGRKLVQMVREEYKSFMRIVVIGYNKEINFYENCGFVKSEDCSSLFVTSLWIQLLVLMIEKEKV